MSEIPLGRREDQHLEFKSRDALENPEIIAREVVALLNAEGGEVWVGLREEQGVAVAVEAISDPEQEQRRLRDYLVDTIEPAPGSREVEVQGVEQVLKVSVREGGRKPYAFLKRGGRHFVVRVGERMRPMAREEITSGFRGSNQEKGDIEEIEKILRSELQLLKSQQPASEIFWLHLKPSAQLSLDLDQLESSDLLLDPATTGNRRGGSTFLAARVWGLRPGRAREAGAPSYLVVGRPGSSELTVHSDGTLLFSVSLKSLHAGHDPGASKPLYPEALAEYPTSVFRLAAKLYDQPSLWEEGKKPPSDSILVVSCALLGLRGWSLRPGSPRLRSRLDFLNSPPKEYQEDDFILEPPLHLKIREVCERPDACGFRLVRRIYADAFLYSVDDLPEEFDRKTGRLILPE